MEGPVPGKSHPTRLVYHVGSVSAYRSTILYLTICQVTYLLVVTASCVTGIRNYTHYDELLQDLNMPQRHVRRFFFFFLLIVSPEYVRNYIPTYNLSERQRDKHAAMECFTGTFVWERK